MKVKGFLSVFLTGVFLAGCMQTTPMHWQHKTIPSSQWGSDHQRCKRAADKYLGLSGSFEADQGLSQYDEQMRVYEAGKKQKKLVADCMRKAGYVPLG